MFESCIIYIFKFTEKTYYHHRWRSCILPFNPTKKIRVLKTCYPNQKIIATIVKFKASHSSILLIRKNHSLGYHQKKIRELFKINHAHDKIQFPWMSICKKMQDKDMEIHMT